MKQNIKTITIILILIFFLTNILTYPKDVIESVNFSISIWKDNLFPVLFPFFIISYFVTSYGISYLFSEFFKPITRFLGLSEACGFTIVASMFSGFPSSSKFIKDQLDNNEITIEEANHLLTFCHFSSPLFIIGTVGLLLLGNKKIGFLIMISHYLAAFITALFFKNKKSVNKTKINLKEAYRKTRKKIKNVDSFAKILKTAIFNALETMFLLLGIVCIFLIITNLVLKIFPATDFLKALLSGTLEMTQGVKNASLLNVPIINRSLIIVAFLSFGGLSIHTQVLSILSNYKISYLKYLSARIIHVISSCFILYLLFTLF